MSARENESPYDLSAIARRHRQKEEKNLGHPLFNRNNLVPVGTLPKNRETGLVRFVQSLTREGDGKPIFREGDLSPAALRRLGSLVTLERLKRGEIVRLGNTFSIGARPEGLVIYKVRHREERLPIETPEPMTPVRMVEKKIRELQRAGVRDREIIELVGGRRNFRNAIDAMARRKGDVARHNKLITRGWRG